jgi:DNA-binding HxlR family transcriptional regulator
MLPFDEIALGEASPVEARHVIRVALSDGSARAAEGIYRALRAWTWKCLSDGRRDEELRVWHEIMARTSAYLEVDHGVFAGKIGVLKELVSESITAGERLPVQEVLQRGHVRDILMEIFRAPNRRAYRAALLRSFGLGQANLSRVLNMMTVAGLIRRTSFGKHAAFSLTAVGLRAAKLLAEPDGPAVSPRRVGVTTTHYTPVPVKHQGAKQVQDSKERLHPTRSVSQYEPTAFSKAVAG